MFHVKRENLFFKASYLPMQKLENSTSIRYVMKNGRLYEAATLTEVWPRQRPLATQWWWRLEPR